MVGAGSGWASGGLVSDGPNQILVSSANGYGGGTPDPVGHIPGSSAPADLADSIIRLVVQPNGSLKAKDFFSMRDDATVDRKDRDLAGSPVALPAEFSTPRSPSQPRQPRRRGGRPRGKGPRSSVRAPCRSSSRHPAAPSDTRCAGDLGL